MIQLREPISRRRQLLRFPRSLIKCCMHNLAQAKDSQTRRQRLPGSLMKGGAVEQKNKEKTLVSSSKALIRFSSIYIYVVHLLYNSL